MKNLDQKMSAISRMVSNMLYNLRIEPKQTIVTIGTIIIKLNSMNHVERIFHILYKANKFDNVRIEKDTDSVAILFN